jgi:hypothetical protein
VLAYRAHPREFIPPMQAMYPHPPPMNVDGQLTFAQPPSMAQFSQPLQRPQSDGVELSFVQVEGGGQGRVVDRDVQSSNEENVTADHQTDESKS